jgi:fatty acid desaturase
VYLAAVIGPHPVALLLWFWFGVTQNGIINLLHESAHGLSFRNQAVARFVGRWLLAPLVLTDLDEYRERHWQHHRRLGKPDDPKLAYHENIHGKRLVWFFLRCITMFEGVRLLQSSKRESAPAAKPGAKFAALGRIAVAQLVFLASIALTALLSHEAMSTAALSVLLAYGFVYGHGLGGLTVFMAGLRAIAEHQIGPDGRSTQGNAALRNFHCGLASRLVFGAYGFAEHATHHLEPSIPHYNLPAATDALGAEEPLFQRRSGYVSTLFLLWTQSPASLVATGATMPPD